MQVKRYILKKMITAVFIVLVVVVINFLIIKLAPGDPRPDSGRSGHRYRGYDRGADH